MGFPAIEKRENKLEKYIGKWVAISIVGNGTIYGKIKGVDGRDVTINPYRALKYDEKLDCALYILSNEDSLIELPSDGVYFEPTNKETFDYLLRNQNEEIIKEKAKKLKERQGKTKKGVLEYFKRTIKSKIQQ